MFFFCGWGGGQLQVIVACFLLCPVLGVNLTPLIPVSHYSNGINQVSTIQRTLPSLPFNGTDTRGQIQPPLAFPSLFFLRKREAHWEGWASATKYFAKFDWSVWDNGNGMWRSGEQPLVGPNVSRLPSGAQETGPSSVSHEPARQTADCPICWPINPKFAPKSDQF